MQEHLLFIVVDFILHATITLIKTVHCHQLWSYYANHVQFPCQHKVLLLYISYLQAALGRGLGRTEAWSQGGALLPLAAG